MDPRAISKAKSRLRNVEGQLTELQNATSYIEFCDHWYLFLTAWKGIYTILEQGAKASPQARQWFGAKQSERRTDDLLQYVYQARNDDEHGLDTATNLDPGYVAIGIKTNPAEKMSMSIDEIRFDANGFKVSGVKDSNGNPIPVVTEVRGPHPVLIPVRDIGGKIYPPPIMHLGNKLPDKEPLTIAKAAYAYACDFLSEAERFS